jgi:hypothetical protein
MFWRNLKSKTSKASTTSIISLVIAILALSGTLYNTYVSNRSQYDIKKFEITYNNKRENFYSILRDSRNIQTLYENFWSFKGEYYITEQNRYTDGPNDWAIRDSLGKLVLLEIDKYNNNIITVFPYLLIDDRNLFILKTDSYLLKVEYNVRRSLSTLTKELYVSDSVKERMFDTTTILFQNYQIFLLNEFQTQLFPD